MKKMILAAVLLAAAAAATAQAHPGKPHPGRPRHGYRHHHHVVATYPDAVTLDGKPYKVCKAGMQDDCVQPRQAGLGYGNMPTNTYRPRHK